MTAAQRFRANAADPRHGTSNGYQNLGCRCDRCRRAWADYYREASHRRGAHRPRDVAAAAKRHPPLTAPDDPRHGTVSGYRTGRCRCDACRAASANERRTERHRQALNRRTP